MKSIIQTILTLAFLFTATGYAAAQKIDEERMKRDIQVSENVLTTLIKQQFNNQRTFFPIEIKGSYQSGYGITFSLPADFTTPIVFNLTEGNNSTMVVGGDGVRGQGFQFRYETDESATKPDAQKAMRLKDKRTTDMDSMRDVYNARVIDAAKTFVVDYGDMLTQLQPGEKIIITNQGNQPRTWVNQYFNTAKRTRLSVELAKVDLNQLKAGKISRDQAMAKVKVMNTEAVDTVEADLELLASMFNRIYRADLSKTYFTENNLYYERLKDFGVIYYLQVLSTYESDYNRFVMPTIGLTDLDMETRNKKVIELYPKFEQELKENMIEYGRTVKSLQDDEVLVLQVRITRCNNCGIPSTVECSIKSSVLKDFNAGKIDKNAALNKIVVKQGAKQ